MNPNGYFIMRREIQTTDLFHKKPSWYFKVWMYIFMNVNYADNGKHKMGEYFFTYHDIWLNCGVSHDGVTVRGIQHAISYLKSVGQIVTHKKTRGMIIKVCDYERYKDTYESQPTTPAASLGDAVGDIQGEQPPDSGASESDAIKTELNFKRKRENSFSSVKLEEDVQIFVDCCEKSSQLVRDQTPEPVREYIFEVLHKDWVSFSRNLDEEEMKFAIMRFRKWISQKMALSSN